MAVIKAVSSKAGIGQAIDYVTKKEKTEKKLVSGLHCEPETVKEEMQATKDLWGKTDGRTYKHYVQSYHEDEEITPEQAHRNAIELAEHTKAWNGHEVLIATHIDKGHIHTHLIVNSVNYEDGHKLQWSKHDLKDLKERCNEQSRRQGLHVPEKGKTFAGEIREETVAWSKDTYQLLKQAEQGKVKSYVQDIALAVLDCKETATSRETFIQQMNERGYGVDWQDSHKYITYTDLAREQAGEKACKIRDNKLEKYYNMDFGKENGDIVVCATTVDGTNIEARVTVVKKDFGILPQSVTVTTVEGTTQLTPLTGRLHLQASVQPENASQLVAWSVVQGAGLATLDEDGVLTPTETGNGDIVVRATSLEDASVYGELTLRKEGFSGDGVEGVNAGQMSVRRVGDDLWIEGLPEDSECGLSIVDSSGRVLFTEYRREGCSGRISLARLASGTYLLRVVTGEDRQTFRFVK